MDFIFVGLLLFVELGCTFIIFKQFFRMIKEAFFNLCKFFCKTDQIFEISIKNWS